MPPLSEPEAAESRVEVRDGERASVARRIGDSLGNSALTLLVSVGAYVVIGHFVAPAVIDGVLNTLTPRFDHERFGRWVVGRCRESTQRENASPPSPTTKAKSRAHRCAISLATDKEPGLLVCIDALLLPLWASRSSALLFPMPYYLRT